MNSHAKIATLPVLSLRFSPRFNVFTLVAYVVPTHLAEDIHRMRPYIIAAAVTADPYRRFCISQAGSGLWCGIGRSAHTYRKDGMAALLLYLTIIKSLGLIE